MTMETRTSATDLAVVPHAVLSAVSHELRGPLGVARGYLRLLAQTAALDPRGAKMVADAQRATDRMSELLDEVSELARWIRGQHTVNLARVPLHEILTAAASGATLPNVAQIRIEVDAPEDVTAEVDRVPLTRAWSALVAATARAQVQDATIALVLRAADPGHAGLRIAPLELLGAADERPPALERAGAGLSLALADLIVQRHGGRLVERWSGEVWAGYHCWLRAPSIDD
jgi:signal transduction histidine kinase